MLVHYITEVIGKYSTSGFHLRVVMRKILRTVALNR